MKLEKLNNKAVWVAVIGFIAMLGKVYGLYQVPDGFDQLANMFLTILTMGGILVDGKPDEPVKEIEPADLKGISEQAPAQEPIQEAQPVSEPVADLQPEPDKQPEEQ